MKKNLSIPGCHFDYFRNAICWEHTAHLCQVCLHSSLVAALSNQNTSPGRKNRSRVSPDNDGDIRNHQDQSVLWKDLPLLVALVALASKSGWKGGRSCSCWPWKHWGAEHAAFKLHLPLAISTYFDYFNVFEWFRHISTACGVAWCSCVCFTWRHVLKVFFCSALDLAGFTYLWSLGPAHLHELQTGGKLCKAHGGSCIVTTLSQRDTTQLQYRSLFLCILTVVYYGLMFFYWFFLASVRLRFLDVPPSLIRFLGTHLPCCSPIRISIDSKPAVGTNVELFILSAGEPRLDWWPECGVRGKGSDAFCGLDCHGAEAAFRLLRPVVLNTGIAFSLLEWLIVFNLIVIIWYYLWCCIHVATMHHLQSTLLCSLQEDIVAKLQDFRRSLPSK